MTNKTKKKISIAIKKGWKRKSTRRKHILAVRKIWQRKGYRKRLSDKLSFLRSDPLYRKRQSKILKKNYRSPKLTKAYRKALSDGQKRAWLEGRRKPNQIVFYKRVSKTEKLLKKECKYCKLKFKTQVRIKGTLYTADFVFNRKLVVEVDGHYSHYKEPRLTKDKIRDKKLKSLGFKVLRLRRKDLKKGFKFCIRKIKRHIKKC